MPLKLKEGVPTDGLPTIKLAGEAYYVAKLRLRERIEIAQLAPKVKALYDKFPSQDEIKGGATVILSKDDFELLIDVVVLGLVRLYPDLVSDDLLDEPIEFDELFEAYPVIIAQGTSRRAGQAEQSGEAKATVKTDSSGEDSSPI